MRSWRNSMFLSGEISTAKRHILPERMAMLLLLIFLGASFAFPMEQAEFPVMAREQIDGVSGADLPNSKGPGQISGASAAIAGCPNIESKGCMSWRSGGRVTVILDPKIGNQGPSFVAAVKQAFLIWAANSGSQGVFFTFSIQSPPADLENQLNRGALPDQTYYVVVDDSSPPRDGYPALTATRICPATIGRYPMGAITFLRPINGAFGAGPGTLREIVTHEIGHTFGLKDCLPSVCPQGTSVMSLPLAGDALLGPTACDKIVIDSMTGFSAWPTPSCTMTASRMTYRICLKGTSDCIPDTSVWEAEPQKIGNRTVMRGYWLGDQLQLKTYGACDSQLGQIEVGSEWADLGNPNNRGLFLYDPPKQLAPYGVSAGTSLIWLVQSGG